MSLDASTRRQIDGAVKNMLNDGKMFTAFEVSLAVKALGVRERHRNMKDYVHEAIAREATGQSWSRTLMDVGAPTQAWVYHRLRDNPFLYVPLERDDAKPKRPSAAAQGRTVRNPTPLSADSPAPAAAEDGAFGTDAEGRLKIPAAMLQLVRIAPGEAAHVRCDKLNQTIVVTRPTQFIDAAHDEKQTTADDGSLTLSPELLARADLDNLQCYHIGATGNRITIGQFTG
jgi:hypothetical protein